MKRKTLLRSSVYYVALVVVSATVAAGIGVPTSSQASTSASLVAQYKPPLNPWDPRELLRPTQVTFADNTEWQTRATADAESVLTELDAVVAPDQPAEVLSLDDGQSNVTVRLFVNSSDKIFDPISLPDCENAAYAQPYSYLFVTYLTTRVGNSITSAKFLAVEGKLAKHCISQFEPSWQEADLVGTAITAWRSAPDAPVDPTFGTRALQNVGWSGLRVFLSSAALAIAILQAKDAGTRAASQAVARYYTDAQDGFIAGMAEFFFNAHEYFQMVGAWEFLGQQAQVPIAPPGQIPFPPATGGGPNQLPQINSGQVAQQLAATAGAVAVQIQAQPRNAGQALGLAAIGCTVLLAILQIMINFTGDVVFALSISTNPFQNKF